PAIVAGGVESISLCQNDKINMFRGTNEWIMKNKPELYLSMIETADIVAARYNVSRESGRVLPDQPAARGGRSGVRQVRRRDRTLHHYHEGAEQGNRRNHQSGSHPDP